MTDRQQPRSPLGWPALTAVLVGGAVIAWRARREALDWQPALALREPWRAFSAAWVHYSGQHLSANVAGALLVGLLGHVAAIPARSAAAWLVAWPLTQLGLLMQPGLLHYGGLSGVLHAGVAVATVHLVAAGNRRQRIIGALLWAGLLMKVVSEVPWQGPLRQVSGWDIALAPFAHASGILMGTLCSGLAEAWHRAAKTATA